MPNAPYLNRYVQYQKKWKLDNLRKTINLLSPISNEAWIEIRKIFKRKVIKKNEFFIREGVKAKNIAFLNNGIIRAFYITKEGNEYTKHFFIQNSFLGGYSSLITKKNNQINQQALTDCEVFFAEYSKFLELYKKFPELEKAGRKIAENRFVEKEQREIELVTLNATERYLIFQKNFPNLELSINQYHIASFLGISPTQLSRIRKKIAKK